MAKAWYVDLVTNFSNPRSLEEKIKEMEADGYELSKVTERFIFFSKPEAGPDRAEAAKLSSVAKYKGAKKFKPEIA